MRILAIIVTYNRCQLLERCINSVMSQSRVPDELLVINNSSTDGTEIMLSRRGIKYITQENLGAASGWNRGISYALSNNFDAVWMMDDDGFPDLDALSKLEKSMTYPRVCVSSVVLQEDSPDKFVFPFPLLNSKQLPVIFSKRRKIKNLKDLNSLTTGDSYPFAHLFNGVLILAEAIKIIGNVNEKFYIYGEEVDYFFRLRKVGEVISLLSAYHYHPNVELRKYNDIKVYYYLKNTLTLNKVYFDWIWIRQIMAFIIILVRIYKRNGKRDFIRIVFNLKLYLAFKRGLQGKISHDFK